MLFPLNSMPVPQTAQLYLELTKLVHLHLTLLEYFLIYDNIFQIVDQSSFFTSGICPDILMNELEDYVILLTCAAGILFNFYLKQNQRCPVWNLTENASLLNLFQWKNLL